MWANRLRQGQGALLMGAGAFVTLGLALATFARSRDEDLPSIGYARVCPVAILMKIVLAQVLLAAV